MKREEYLGNPEVRDFIRWIGPRLDTDGLFVHQYLDRRCRQRWQCVSIYDAFRQYRWPFDFRDHENHRHSGSNFADSNRILSGLHKQLGMAVRCGDTAPLLAASCTIFEWGKVTIGNVDWARRNAVNLCSIYRRGMSLLDPKTADDMIDFPYRFNSGLTKVYSLLLDDFIIYDSRVGAALGYLVVQYCLAQGLGSVPHLLRFPWAPAKEANPVKPKKRDPSFGQLVFEQIRSHQEHARWNLRASWLLKGAVSESKRFLEQSDPLRALEAALFMIGYDLGGSIARQQPTRSFADRNSANDILEMERG